MEFVQTHFVKKIAPSVLLVSGYGDMERMSIWKTLGLNEGEIVHEETLGLNEGEIVHKETLGLNEGEIVHEETLGLNEGEIVHKETLGLNEGEIVHNCVRVTPHITYTHTPDV